jgi:tetratricopeptide (TPR) repeat protein
MIAGKVNAAMRSMVIAVQLAPNNRHILRSAARLFLLVDDRERAHDVIVRSPATPRDPWLLSSELVFAELAKRRPRFVKNAREIVEDENLPFRQVTEVAGALATDELTNGSRKKARRLFGRSLLDPNGNALAQAEWASPSFGSEIVGSTRFTEVSEASEALAFHLFHEEKLTEVPPVCEEWANNEPYSIRPYEFGSSTAGMIEDFEQCEKLARRGLVIRQDAPLLLNNLAFALASSGRAEAALITLSHLKTDENDRQTLVATANRGLAHFRLGHAAEGRSLYEKAIRDFEQRGEQRFADIAQAYLAREAVRARSADYLKLLKESQARADKLRWPYLSKLVTETARLLDAPTSAVQPQDAAVISEAS